MLIKRANQCLARSKRSVNVELLLDAQGRLIPFSFVACTTRNKSIHKLRYLCLFPLNKYDPVCASIPLPLMEQVGNSASDMWRASPAPIPKRCWGQKRFQVPVTGSCGYSRVQARWTRLGRVPDMTLVVPGSPT